MSVLAQAGCFSFLEPGIKQESIWIFSHRYPLGLLASRSVAERTAQDLNLVNNPQIVSQKADASTRLSVATGRVAAGILRAPLPATAAESRAHVR